jgi:hypothetical protein
MALLMVAAGQPNVTNAAEARPCAPRSGEPRKPLVPDVETARSIFLAVEKRFHPAADVKNFPHIMANDEGDSWAVFRGTARPGTKGGGQLEMRVAKCNGAISEVYFSK